MSRKIILIKDRKSGSAGMPRPISYAVFCLKKKSGSGRGEAVAAGAGRSDQAGEPAGRPAAMSASSRRLSYGTNEVSAWRACTDVPRWIASRLRTFSCCTAYPRNLQSFPTRRSSDLLQSFIASMTQKLTLSDISDESKNYLDKAGITTACLRIKSKWTAGGK